MTILHDNRDTEFGREHGFAEITDADDYRRHVPLSDYEDYAERVNRMMNGTEKNLLSAYPITYYAVTGGTTGVPKLVPVSDRGITNIREYSSAVMPAVISEFFRNTKLTDVPDGFRLTLLSLMRKKELPNGSFTGFISSACLSDSVLSRLESLYTTPRDVLFSTEGTDLKYLHSFYGLSERNVTCLTAPYVPILLDFVNYIKNNWQRLVEDIRQGQLSSDIKIPDWLREKLQTTLSPNPRRADELQATLSQGFDRGVLKRIWPRLSAVTAVWAGTYCSYARKLQEFTGHDIPYYTMSYSSSEGVFAVARHPFDQYYVMTPDTCFYEFIPVDDEEPSAPDSSPATLLMDELQEGRDYELVITNQSGFYRYRIGDVVRVVGFYNESPMIEFRYRKKNMISLVGEHFTEEHLASAIRTFEQKTGIQIIDYCIYTDRDAEPPRYGILIEPNETPDLHRHQEYTEILQQALLKACTSYADYFDDDVLGMPRLYFLQPQTFQLYREIKMYKIGISENQLKPVRVLHTPELIQFFTKLEDCIQA